MKTPELFAKLMDHARTVAQLTRLPQARLRFDQYLHPDDIRRAHAYFTQRHPRLKIFRNKTIGIALIDLAAFDGEADGYLQTVRRTGYAGAKSRKATARGYRLREIDRNDHIDEIHAIHTSCAERQGRPLDSTYRIKKTHYDKLPHASCYGVFNAQGSLAAYCSLVRYGNFVSTDQLMGYKNNDGSMDLLLSSIVCRLIEARDVDYFMYDTFLGAQPGLRDFKRRCGFRPYRARYGLANAICAGCPSLMGVGVSRRSFHSARMMHARRRTRSFSTTTRFASEAAGPAFPDGRPGTTSREKSCSSPCRPGIASSRRFRHN